MVVDLNTLGQFNPSVIPGLDELGQLQQLANADPTPAIMGAGAALLVGVLATPITGALIATYAPRSPWKGAALAIGLGIGSTILATALATAGAAATVASVQQ